MLPALFVSHGAPSLPFDDVPARDFLRGLGREMGKPRAILIASAHWDTDTPRANAVAVNDTIHDFGGFPQALYDIRYPAPGDALLAREVSALIGGQVNAVRGLDHGAWVPLMLMFPDADIPVVQLSVQSQKGAAHHIALGRGIAKLRHDNVLVMGSGGFVHNLGRIAPPGAPEPDWSREFSDWIHGRLLAGDETALADYRKSAPHAALAQPTEDHFMPLFVAL
ncbi:MAG TPA: class III extradiol ring-cleavage dioxygenase, partial [Rhizomicrobium sp.]|nr:class III extradiol ring-cleavage dioxygenase [Rhizomicrobium sp.]